MELFITVILTPRLLQTVEFFCCSMCLQVEGTHFHCYSNSYSPPIQREANSGNFEIGVTATIEIRTLYL